MKSRNTLSLFLIFAMLITLVACAGGTAWAAGDDAEIDTQINLIFTQLDKLLQKDGEQPWYYSVTDLDHDGYVEFIAASQHPLDRSANVRVWEVSTDGSALTECVLVKNPDESFPDILADCADTFYEAGTDTWSYLFYDNVVLSANEVYTSKSAYHLKDGAISYQAFAVEHALVENGWRSVSHTDANGIAISQEQYNAAGVNAFPGAERCSTNFDWFTVSDIGNLSRLADSFAVFTGRKAPTEVFPVPKPEALQKPAASPAPSAPPAPAPTPAPVYLSITKNPTNENRRENETALFVSCANVYESLSWTMISPDGGEYTVQSFRNRFPRASVTGEYSTTLSIEDTAVDMSGWGAYCTFYYRGQTARTTTAWLYVSENKPQPTPGGTYSGTVVDWTYNTVMINVEGQGTVTISRSLCDVDGDLYYGAPASVDWNGVSITYCFIWGSHPSPEPTYGSMGGNIYQDTAYSVYVVLQDGSAWHLDASLVSVPDGVSIDGASCTVYYTGYPSDSTIYLVEVYGYTPIYPDEPWYPDPEPWYPGKPDPFYPGIPKYISCPNCGIDVRADLSICPYCDTVLWDY